MRITLLILMLLMISGCRTVADATELYPMGDNRYTLNVKATVWGLPSDVNKEWYRVAGETCEGKGFIIEEIGEKAWKVAGRSLSGLEGQFVCDE